MRARSVSRRERSGRILKMCVRSMGARSVSRREWIGRVYKRCVRSMGARSVSRREWIGRIQKCACVAWVRGLSVGVSGVGAF